MNYYEKERKFALSDFGVKKYHKKVEKLIDKIKKIDPGIILVGFKYEPDAGKRALIKEARLLMRSSNSDFIVANTQKNGKYTAYIVSGKMVGGPFLSKNALVNSLSKLVA